MSDLNEIIRAKDLQICELLSEIQVLKSKLQEQNICLDVSLNEISIDNTEITDTMTLNVPTNDVPTNDDGMDVMNLINMLMGEKTSSANPLMEMMQQMMGAENNADPIMEMMQNMMGEVAQTDEADATQADATQADATQADAEDEVL
jgi:exoribonuclease R